MNGSFTPPTRLAAGGSPTDCRRGVSTLTTWVWSARLTWCLGHGKAAVHAMTMSLAVEWARYGIRLMPSHPGPIPTDYAWRCSTHRQSSVGATQADAIPMGRMGTVPSWPNLEMFLLSDACPYLTGETIAMDGGQRLAGPNTFAGLSSLTDADWAEARARSMLPRRFQGDPQRLMRRVVSR